MVYYDKTAERGERRHGAKSGWKNSWAWCALLRHKKDALYLPYEQPVTWETIRQVIKEALREES